MTTNLTDKAQLNDLLCGSLASYRHGPAWSASMEELINLRKKVAALEKENEAMRRGKKKVERDLLDATEELKAQRHLREKYDAVMAIVSAVNLSAAAFPAPEKDCE